jgi:phosphoribosylformylglycinamidine synthase
VIKVRFSVAVEVQVKAGVADPQGATIERSLPALGFPGVSGVRVGKLIRFAVEAADEASARAEVDEMCRRFLTNPVIEDAVVRIDADESVGAGQ